MERLRIKALLLVTVAIYDGDCNYYHRLIQHESEAYPRSFMKRTPKSRVTSLFNRIFKIRYWSDAERVKGFFQYIQMLFQRLFILQPKPAKESFETVQKRLNLTDEALLIQQRSLFRLSVLMCLFALFMLGYTIYQCFHGYFFAIVLSCVVSLLAFAFAFRYHFWYFQIQQRQLGCSLRVWFKQGLLRRTKP